MGNSNSQSLHQQQHRPHPHHSPGHVQSWANSYPRDPHAQRALGRTAPENKVLPERIPGQRLRVTNNGAILHNGGTISGRKQLLTQVLPDDDQPPGRVFRSRSTSTHQHSRQSQPRNDNLNYNGKRFGSEPDLRFSPRDHNDSPAKQRITRSRKKYKAPAPPPGGESHGPDSSSPDSLQWESTLDPPARRMRLFKTRAETKKTAPTHRRPDDTALSKARGEASPVVQRSLSTPQFQMELVQAAQRLRANTVQAATMKEREPPVGEAVRGEGSGQESTPELLPRHTPAPTAPLLPPRKKQEHRKPEKKHWEIISPGERKPVEQRDVPSKTFYFGMEQGEREAVERFAASLHRGPPTGHTTTSGSGGSITSEGEVEVGVGGGGIALQLRPTLPKKQLQIPRFSPTAAWRLLSALDTPGVTSPGPEDHSVLVEERIQRLSRPVAPPPLQQTPRSSHDKSGDSGISGDASPGGCHEDSSAASPPVRQPPAVAWTPQQDLEGEEESSSDGGLETHQQAPATRPTFSPRANVFSLSLPRDDRLCMALYSDNPELALPTANSRRNVQPSFNSLKKLQRSVSGALGAALNSKAKEDRAEPLDNNWLLSRSVPNSLNNGHEIVWEQQAPSSGSPSSPDRPSFSYLASGGHIMYLPECDPRERCYEPSSSRERSYSAGLALRNLRSFAPLSKSCENISTTEMRQIGRTPSPEPVRVDTSLGFASENEATKRSKGKRFTFQSTVRQIERRRLAEKLSREAELKERRRLGELEAMQRVEEEFQRKRAREKANIRQQLRIFSMDDTSNSLPAGWGADGTTRAEPDGAPSPSSHSSSAHSGKLNRAPSTQVLSEFREPRREYREYRPASRYVESGPESILHLETRKATVHPQVVYDMPKSTQVYIAAHETAASQPVSDNYRRNFAHGALPGRSLASSDSELSQPNTRPPSRQGQGHHRPRHRRSRSASPDSVHRRLSPEPGSSLDTNQRDSTEPAPDCPEVAPPFIPPQNSSPVAAREESRFSLSSLQPFVRNGKSYRPIVFNPRTSSSNKVAQPVS